LIGYRVNQIYDIDNKTYLIKLHRNEEKTVLLMESGNRIHTTSFEWSKSISPSGFTMKLRKHLKNKRLENIEQLGTDRIVLLQFGTGEACYYVILELYDRGNIVLCDFNYICLNVLRPHVEGEEVRFAVKEKYPLSRARDDSEMPSMNVIKDCILKARQGDSLKTILNPILPFGAAVIDHWLIKSGLNDRIIKNDVTEKKEETEVTSKKKKNRDKNKEQIFKPFKIDEDFTPLINAINNMFTMMKSSTSQESSGYIIQKKELKPTGQTDQEEFYFSNIEFHPFLFSQYETQPYKEFPTFMQAVDEFFSSLESQKIDLKSFQLERDALKKLSNVRQDHASRLENLAKSQSIDKKKAELLKRNQILVDNVILSIRSLIAKQLPWQDIKDLIKSKQEHKDPVALMIRHLKFETNQIVIHLTDPYADNDSDDDTQVDDDEEKLKPMDIEIDLGISAYSNATKYYDLKRYAAKKEQKTIDASGKALKSAEKKTQQTLKEVRIQTTITKARKVYWFEKFYWFISSENYLIIGGRDQQQNELIVKRYLRSNDIYVHAEIQGASSVVIKNPTSQPIPPKTMSEAGTMAISYSVAWDAKVATNAYWVYSDQVSKTAPTGEYLSTGSFMIRGKKNFLPPCNLILGLSFLFKLEESSIERHKGERRVRRFDDDASSIAATDLESINEEEIVVESDEEDGTKVEEADENKIPDAQTVAVETGTVKTENSDEEEEEDNSQFPDTHIKVEHSTGEVDIKFDPKISVSQHEEMTLVEAAPLKVKKYEKKLKPQKKQPSQPQQQDTRSTDEKNQNPKRGQKGKMKKIKEKYRDQDDEERDLRMRVLKSSGTLDSNKTNESNQESEKTVKRPESKKPNQKLKNDEEIEEAPAADEVDMIDSLTGSPVEEDELLFAGNSFIFFVIFLYIINSRIISVPVVAPYQSLQNYK
jgi:predicted ribosome quality control (RQC) complex YloA/Tae2 family protein